MPGRFRRRKGRRELDAVPAGAAANGNLLEAVRTRVAVDERTAIERRVAAERVRRVQNLAVDRELTDLHLYSIAAGVKAIRAFRQALLERELIAAPGTAEVLTALDGEHGIESAVGIAISGYVAAVVDQEGPDRHDEAERMAVAALQTDEERQAVHAPGEHPRDTEFQYTLLHALMEAALGREVSEDEVAEQLPLWLAAWRSGWLLFDDMRASYAPGADPTTL